MVEFKIADFFYPVDILRTYFLLRRSEHWKPEQFQRYQAHHLAHLLRFTGQQVPYYRTLFAEIGILPSQITPENAVSCLRRLPILSKTILSEKAEQFISSNYHKFHPRPVSTSGTTGTPLTIYWDKGSNIIEFCCTQRLWRWVGFLPGQTFLDLRSRPMPAADRLLKRSGQAIFLYNPKVRGIEMSSDLIHEGNLQDYYQVLLHYQPGLIRGHPQAIDHLAYLLTKHKLEAWKPTAITTASETLYEFQRQQIQQAFAVPVLDSYGLKEHNVFITQCRAGSYHISPEYGVCEILDDAGEDVPPGQEGWIVATGLHNHAQPLLRYNTLDRAVASHGNPCPCGRTLPTVQSIVGRIDDCIYTRDGKRYSGFSFAFFDRPGLKKARLVQIDWDHVQVEVLANENFSTRVQEDLIRTLDVKVNYQTKFYIKSVEVIRQEFPGKFKFVVSHVAPKNVPTPQAAQ